MDRDGTVVGPSSYYFDPQGNCWLVDVSTGQLITYPALRHFTSSDCTGPAHVAGVYWPRVVVQTPPLPGYYTRTDDSLPVQTVVASVQLADGGCTTTSGTIAATSMRYVGDTLPAVSFSGPLHQELR